MSRGFGRVERAIATTFTRHPARCFTTDELIARAYPGIRYADKKHHVTVLLAAKKIAGLLRWSWLRMHTPGRPALFFNLLDETSYLWGHTRARCPGWSSADIAKNIRHPLNDDWQDIYATLRRESEAHRLDPAITGRKRKSCGPHRNRKGRQNMTPSLP